MIRTGAALLRMAQDFFRTELVGVYSFDKDVRIEAQERREPIPANLPFRERRRVMEEREGRGKWIEKERLLFGPWQILIYSAAEKGPLGEVSLRASGAVDGEPLVVGPLDPATWAKIGEVIRVKSSRLAS